MDHATISFQLAEPENDAGLVWKKRNNEGRFVMARDGDMLVSPFQCDICWFRNLTLRSPKEDSMSDNRLLTFIRRANLDMLWGTSISIVTSTK